MTRPIYTERLALRPRCSADLEDCIAMDRDPLVTKYIAGPWNDPKAHRDFLFARMAQTHIFPFGYWTITQTQRPDVFLGWIMILPENGGYERAEIGWRLSRASWGKGVATEAALGIVELTQKHFPGTQIFAKIHSENLGSIKMAEKIGMTFQGTSVSGGVEKIYVLDPSAW